MFNFHGSPERVSQTHSLCKGESRREEGICRRLYCWCREHRLEAKSLLFRKGLCPSRLARERERNIVSDLGKRGLDGNGFDHKEGQSVKVQMGKSFLPGPGTGI